MWYYSLNNQPTGPVDSETLKSLLRAGTINLNTLIWQEGMPDWKKLGDTPLGAQANQPVQPVIPVYQPYQPVTPTSQPAPTYSNYPTAATPGTPPPFFSQVNLTGIKNLYVWWLVLFVLSAFTSIIFLFVPDYSDAYTALACASSLVSIPAGVLVYIQVYRFWKLIQDGYAETTPGKAWGFLLIPFFNFYWVFKAFYGLSKNMNSFIDRHYSTIAGAQIRRSNPVFSLMYCFGFLINYFVFVANYASNISNSAAFYEGDTALTVGYAVFSLIFLVISIATFTDFYQTAKSILENQK
jgi:hypothetical protein